MLGRYRESVRVLSDPVGRALVRLHLRPNHLTVLGLAVSLLAAAAFIAGRTRLGGVLLIGAGLADLLDGSLARASGQVTAFGAFLDSVIDRYSDLVVLIAIVVLFARMPHTRGALVAMAGLVGSVMVSYTKARAESIGVDCNVGMMERPERLICLIAGALLDLLEPALWALAILANLTALQRIVFTRRVVGGSPLLRAVLPLILLSPLAVGAAELPAPAPPGAETERAWRRAVEAWQGGAVEPLLQEFGREAALGSLIGDYARFLLADALARRGDLGAARRAALGVVDHHPGSRLAPAALLMAATLASRAGREDAAHAALARLLDAYPDAAEAPEALYLLGQAAEARGDPARAVAAYRHLVVLAPASGWADGAGDRLAALAAAGTRVRSLTLAQRIERAERLLRGGVPKTAADEAEAIAREAREPSVVARALRVVADSAARLGRYGLAAHTLGLLVDRASGAERSRLLLEQGRLYQRGGQHQKAIALFKAVAATAPEAEAAEALYQQARSLDELDRATDAAAVYRALASRYPNRDVAGAALWRLGWIAWLGADAALAERHWARLAELPGGRAWRLPALYWAGRAAAEVRGRAAAEPRWARVLAEGPRSYYGVLAARRAATPARPPSPAPVTLPADPLAAVAADPGFMRVEVLRRIGLVEDAWAELEEVVERSVGDPVRLYGLSGAWVRDERYHMALRIFRRHFVTLAATGAPALPRAFWETFYPFGWRADVERAAQRAGLDPYLVAAVVREESSYHPRAQSRAGARGLMQLMPGTARSMAEHRGLAFGDGELLEDPRANLEIGTAFLAGLVREFGDVRLALAAYNAGPRRVRLWWQARRTSDVEAFVEQIPFDETRHYVKRVILSWEEYRRIWAE